MKKLHLICNSHIDPVWQWTWDEGISACLSTFKSACDCADLYDYVFCHNESMLYETVEAVDPDLFARIKKFVKENKWAITGGCYLQPDVLMPHGETLTRMFQEGKRYFSSKFDKEPTVNCNFDSFGHSLGLVQIMAKSGFKGYLICRPNGNQFTYPGKFFNWVGPDGSKVIVSQSPTYISALGHAKDKILQTISGNNISMLGSSGNPEKETVGIEDVDYVLWGVGNHGGGPSKEDLKQIKELKVDGVEIIHSSPERLFDENVKISGEIKTSLVTAMPGCYTSMAKIKQNYRTVENLYYQVEKLVSLCKLSKIKVDDSKLNEALKHIFLATFHDILPGTVAKDGEREGLSSLLAAERILKDLRTNIFLKLSTQQKVAEEGEYPVFAFNYESKEKKCLVEVEFTLKDQNWDPKIMFEPVVYINGKEIPSQCIKEESTLNLDWRKKVVFEATLSPLSLTRCSIRTKAVPRIDKFKNPASIDIKKNVTHYADLVLYDDSADPWAMSDLEQKVMGTNPRIFEKMDNASISKFTKTNKGLESEHLIEDGNILTRYEGLYSLESTKAVIQYTKYKNQTYEDIKAIVEFNEKNSMLKLRIAIPEEFKGGIAVGDGPYIVEEKVKSSVYPIQKWFGIKKGNKYFAIANSSIYGAYADENYIYLVLLRGAGYCFHPINDLDLYPQDRYMPRIDCGRYEFNFRVIKGDLFEVCSLAESLNNPVYAVNVFPTGEKDIGFPNVSLEGNAILSAIKESKGGIIFRVYNPLIEKSDFTFKVNESMLKDTLKPNEIVSISFNKGKLEIDKEHLL